jgi:hypothetical protein
MWNGQPSGPNEVCENRILRILPATNSGAPYLTRFFVGRCGKITDLDRLYLGALSEIQELAGESSQFTTSPHKKRGEIPGFPVRDTIQGNVGGFL